MIQNGLRYGFGVDTHMDSHMDAHMESNMDSHMDSERVHTWIRNGFRMNLEWTHTGDSYMDS